MAPFLSETIKDEVDAPASFLADFVEDAKDFILFGSIGETFSYRCQGAKGYAGNTPRIISRALEWRGYGSPVFHMRNNAAKLTSILHL